MASAGSGKTWGICNEVINNRNTCGKRILIVTYTNKGVESIKQEYQKQNSGIIDDFVDIKTWYQFLLSDLIKPYQKSMVGRDNRIRSLDFSQSYGKINYIKRGDVNHYLTKHDDVLSNAASELAIDCNTASGGKVISRLCEVFESIYIDEIQDIAGADFDILELLFSSSINITCVGDYKQSTYTTHNARKMKKVTGQNIVDYFKSLELKCIIQLVYKNETRRFNKKICMFSNTIYAVQNADSNVCSSIEGIMEHEGVFLLQMCDFELYQRVYQPAVLRYDIKTDTCGCNSLNFGQCKGMTFDHVVIFPNAPFKNFILKNTPLKSPSKYYVAATRARHSVVFILDKLPKEKKFAIREMEIGGQLIKIAEVITT